MFVEANNNSFINNFTLDLYWCILGYSTPFTFDWCVSIFKGCTIGYSTHTFYLRLLPYIVYSILHFRALGTITRLESGKGVNDMQERTFFLQHGPIA